MKKINVIIIIMLLVILATAMGQNTYWRDRALENDPLALVSLGMTEGITSLSKFGDVDNIDGVGDIWHGYLEQPLYVFPDSLGEYVNLYSTVPGDAGIAITIQGVSITGRSKDTTVVLGADSVYVLERWLSINRAFNSGTTEFTGDVKIIGRSSGNIFAFIDPDDQQTTQMPFMVPAGKVAVIYRTATTINKAENQDAGCIVNIKTRFPHGVFRTRVRYGVQKRGTSTYTSLAVNGIPLPPLTQVRVIATTDDNASVASILDLRVYDSSIYPDILIDKLLGN